MTRNIKISGENQVSLAILEALSKQTGLSILDKTDANTICDYLLFQTAEQLTLKCCKFLQIKPLHVDFLNGKLNHRRNFGGGKNQMIARAIGLNRLNKNKALSVIDATAGLGQDSFVLALLGCNMTLLERSKIVYRLLYDAIQRVKQSTDQQLITLFESIQLHQTDAITYLETLSPIEYPDVIYLDPMFPTRKKKALVKKEMRFLHDVVGKDIDSNKLLQIALQRAKKRVVVKRPKFSSVLNSETAVNFSINGKSVRYDIYLM